MYGVIHSNHSVCVCVCVCVGGGVGRGRRKRAGKRRERGSHREGKVVGRKGGLGCDQDIECS